MLIPVLVIMMAGLGLGLGIIISSLTTKYRDFTVLLGFAVQLLMYATPVAYSMSFLPEKYAAILRWNPLSSILESFRYAVFGQGILDLGGLVYSACFMIMVLFFGTLIFNKVERSFMDTV